MDAQLRKGLLELCVLAVLRKEDSYGYQIIKDVSDLIENFRIHFVSYFAKIGDGWKSKILYHTVQ